MILGFYERDDMEWQRTRKIEFANYSSTIGFNGKQAFKSLKSPKDLYRLSSDVSRTTVKFDRNRAEQQFERFKKARERLRDKRNKDK